MHIFTQSELSLLHELVGRHMSDDVSLGLSFPEVCELHDKLASDIGGCEAHSLGQPWVAPASPSYDDNPYDMDSYCVKCQATTPEARYPHQLHTTGMAEWTCCACLGHGYKDDGVCTQISGSKSA
jgi:hypothetical protein